MQFFFLFLKEGLFLTTFLSTNGIVEERSSAPGEENRVVGQGLGLFEASSSVAEEERQIQDERLSLIH